MYTHSQFNILFLIKSYFIAIHFYYWNIIFKYSLSNSCLFPFYSNGLNYYIHFSLKKSAQFSFIWPFINFKKYSKEIVANSKGKKSNSLNIIFSWDKSTHGFLYILFFTHINRNMTHTIKYDLQYSNHFFFLFSIQFSFQSKF